MSAFDRLLAASLPLVPKPIVKHFSRPYVAGETTEEMCAAVRAINSEGMLATVDVLGEFSKDREQADRAVARYETVMEEMAGAGLKAKISLKLTQLGLKMDKNFCHDNVARLVAKAVEQSSFVRIDMEDSSCTRDTLEIYFRLQKLFGHRVGPVIQAYLRRSLDDVRRLGEVKANVRLCKGIYIEPRGIAYTDPELVNRNFGWLLEELFEAGCYVGIATHDERLVWDAFRIIEARGLDPSQYEFQMLLGVQEELRRLILDAGHRLRVYVPFGRQWYAYSMRRLRENPKIAGYVARSFFQTAGPTRRDG